MDKKIVVLFIAGIVIFAGIVIAINVYIKRYTWESIVPGIPSRVKQESLNAVSALEKNKAQGPQEEPERELPIQSEEPLLN